MSRRNKLQKFAELATFPNVYQNFDVRYPELVTAHGRVVEMQGSWSSAHFGNPNPIVLELACGRGEYSLGMGKMQPQKNFIGVDIKGARIWKGARTALAEGLGNVAFLRTRIEFIVPFFHREEVDEIWITFPDPFLRKSKVNRRLTAPVFLQRYRQFLRIGGIVHLKTDNDTLFDFTLETLAADQDCEILYQSSDIYAKPLAFPELDVRTYYERMHLANGLKIKYVRFTIS